MASKHDASGGHQSTSSKPGAREEVVPDPPTLLGKLINETQNAYIIDNNGVESTIFKADNITVTQQGDTFVVSS